MNRLFVFSQPVIVMIINDNIIAAFFFISQTKPLTHFAADKSIPLVTIFTCLKNQNLNTANS